MKYFVIFFVFIFLGIAPIAPNLYAQYGGPNIPSGNLDHNPLVNKFQRKTVQEESPINPINSKIVRKPS